jgi:hypothetical protein
MKKSELKKIISESILEVMYEQTLPSGISSDSVMTLDQFVKGSVDEADGDFLGARTKPLSPEEMQAYMDRIKNKTKEKGDKYNLPYIHGSNIEIKNEAGRTYDQDKLKAAIKTRPSQILKQNAKMAKSAGPDTIFFDIGLPALKGLAVNEKTDEFIVVDTCPGAGKCKIYCYAMKGGYVQWKDVSMSQTRLLNYLINDPQGFKAQFESELKSKAGSALKKKKKILVRWHDAGDFFSPEYLNLAFEIARNFPDVEFYAYTKMAGVAQSDKPKNFKMNFSMGATPDQEKQIDFEKTKHSTVIPKPMFDKYIMKDENGKAVRDEKNRIQFKDEDALNSFKKDLASKYNVPVESVLTYDEMLDTPKSDEENKYNVIVRPGDGDVSASRGDVKGTYLLIH